MPSQLLSLLLALQMTLPLSQAVTLRPTSSPLQVSAQVQQLWWGMLDPELSARAARIPMDELEGSQAVQWCWSWQSFLAALLGLPMTKEAANAPSV